MAVLQIAAILGKAWRLFLPLYTYVISHAGQTATCQLRKSNPQGWLLQAVSSALPSLAKVHAGEVLRIRLEPVQGLERTWQGRAEIAGYLPGPLNDRIGLKAAPSARWPVHPQHPPLALRL